MISLQSLTKNRRFELFVGLIAKKIAASLPVAECEQTADAYTYSLAIAPLKS